MKALAFTFFGSSVFLFVSGERAGHGVGLLAFAPFVAFVTWVGLRPLVSTSVRTGDSRVASSSRRGLLALALILAALVLSFAVLYPRANSGRWGKGSDGDEASMLAIGALLHGRSPYETRTYLDNPISPMPGGLILGIPFFLLGNVAYQNLFWVACAVFATGRAWQRRSGDVARLLGTTLLACPAVLHQIATGTDYLANSLAVTLLCAVVAAAPPWSRGQRSARVLAPAALLGVALSWRGNFLFVLPFLHARRAHLDGRARAWGSTLLSVATFLAVTLPFSRGDGGAFTPWHVLTKLTGQVGRPDLLVSAVLVLAVIATVLLARRSRNTSLRDCFLNMAVVQAILVLAICVAFAGRRGAVMGLVGTVYGQFSLWFLLASWVAGRGLSAIADATSVTGEAESLEGRQPDEEH